MYPDDEMKGIAHQGREGKPVGGRCALLRILEGTGFVDAPRSRAPSPSFATSPSAEYDLQAMHVAAATAPAVSGAALETVTVTSSKIGGDVQNIPISITAMSQEQLTATQTAGGPDLVKQVPNLTFSKTNFTGYNIQIRGIGTQAISVTTDPAVAVAFNDIPFIRNHFFEQEFYDVSQVEVLRGPQGTLYGRNATAGVVNLVSAKPTDQFEAMASADIGNYQNRRFEGMINIPIVGDRLDLRVAGEWTKRDGYTFNEETDQSVDGRDLWSGRVSLLVQPIEKLHGQSRLGAFQRRRRPRAVRQAALHERSTGRPWSMDPPGRKSRLPTTHGAAWLTPGLRAGSALWADRVRNAQRRRDSRLSLRWNMRWPSFIPPGADPYAGVAQSQNLRVIDSQLDPKYRAKNDTFEFNADYDVTGALTLTSQTGYNKDFLYSTEDYNRFNYGAGTVHGSHDLGSSGIVGQDGEFCDPQLGCSTGWSAKMCRRNMPSNSPRNCGWRRISADRSISASAAIILHYQTVEDYYVFYQRHHACSPNMSTMPSAAVTSGADAPHVPFDPAIANSCNPQPADPANARHDFFGLGCGYGSIPIRSARSTARATIISAARIPIG